MNLSDKSEYLTPLQFGDEGEFKVGIYSEIPGSLKKKWLKYFWRMLYIPREKMASSKRKNLGKLAVMSLGCVRYGVARGCTCVGSGISETCD